MEKNRLGYEKLPKLLASLAIPSIVAQLVNVLYNMVDRIYIGQMQDGTAAMAALSITLPVVTMITAFTKLFGVGGAPLCAIRMGQQDEDGAEKIMTNSYVMLILCSLVLTVSILLFKRPLLFLFGATKETIANADAYLSIYILGTISIQLTLGMNAYINTQGFAKKGMMTVLIGAAANIILDPLFIFVLDMGVSGAALATVISQGISAFWVLKFLFGRQSVLKIRKRYFRLDRKVCLSIMALGVSPFVMYSTDGLLQIAFNSQLIRYGGTVAVATMSNPHQPVAVYLPAVIGPVPGGAADLEL